MSVLTDYTTKDYEAFRSMMIEELKNKLPEYTDTSQTDAGIVIIELLAKGLDILSYYQDVIANETLLPTCELRSSALKWCQLLGYSPLEATPSKCKQIFKKSVTGDITIPKGTQVTTSENVIFETVKDLYIPSGKVGDEVDPDTGEYLYTVDVVQGYTVKNEFVSRGDGTENQTYTSLYAPALIGGVDIGNGETFGELELTVSGVKWTRASSFIGSGTDSKVYVANINENGNIQITFGSKLLGRIPQSSDDIQITYRVGGGEVGNVAVGAIKNLVTSITGITSTENVTNPLGNDRGFEQESLSSIKINAPSSFRTLNRAVTLQDHTDLILLNPDFNTVKSVMTYQKQKTDTDANWKDTVQIYVQYAYGSEVEEDALLKIKDYINSKQIIGTFAEVYEAQAQEISIVATLVVEDGFDEFSVQRDVKDATYLYASKKSKDVGENFSVVDYELYITLRVSGVKYFRVSTPTTLVITPSRGCYLQIPDTEDENENNPNLTINITHE